MRPLARAVLLPLVVLVGTSGCHSYAVLLSTRPAASNGEPLTDADISRALAAVSHVASDFSLSPSPHLETSQSAWAEGHPSYRLLSLYVRSADRETGRSDIFVAAYLDDATSFNVIVRAWDNVRETNFSQSLRERLEDALRAALPSRRVAVERVRDLPLLVRP